MFYLFFKNQSTQSLNLIYYNFIQSKDTKLDIDMDFLMFPVRVKMIHFLKNKKNVI